MSDNLSDNPAKFFVIMAIIGCTVLILWHFIDVVGDCASHSDVRTRVTADGGTR